MSDTKPKSGLPRWYPGKRLRGIYADRWATRPGWIVLVCLTPEAAVVRFPGAVVWSLSSKEWLSLSEDRPDAP